MSARRRRARPGPPRTGLRRIEAGSRTARLAGAWHCRKPNPGPEGNKEFLIAARKARVDDATPTIPDGTTFPLSLAERVGVRGPFERTR